MASRFAFGQVITQPATGRHSATLIMLHGLGDTGHGWAPVGPQLNLSHVKMMFPTAPTRPITCNMGMRMPGWFDIVSLERSALEASIRTKGRDPDGLLDSVAYIKDLIGQEVAAGIPEDRIVVGGFSQGGKIALRTFLDQVPSLAGCVAMSTWLEPNQTLGSEKIKERPVFLAHGSADPMLPSFLAQKTYDELQRLGFTNVDFKIYPGMEHSSCYEELQDLKKFLLKVIPDTPLTKDDVKAFSVRQLKQFLHTNGVSSTGVYEKGDLIELALKQVS